MLPLRPLSRSFLAGAALVAASAASGPSPARAIDETIYLPTAYVVPTSGVVSTSFVSPTSYVVPTSSLLSTSYLVPTSSILSTSYVVPTSSVMATSDILVPTSTTYYRPSILRPRRYVERTTYSYAPTSYLSTTSTLLPTSYYVPTSYLSTSYLAPTSYLVDTGFALASTSASPCDVPSTSTSAAMRSTSGSGSGSNSTGGNSITSKPTNGNGAASNEPPPQVMLNGGGGIPSNVDPAVPANPTPASNKPKGTGTGTGGTGSLPEPPAIVPGDAGTPPAQTPVDPNKITIPPAGSLGPNETMSRIARRPAFDNRNILQGRVISAESRLPVEGVTIVLSSQTGSFADRTRITDAYGEFNVSLPDGDWTVKVKMRSGALVAVEQGTVTASGGRVADPSGRTITDYTITR